MTSIHDNCIKHFAEKIARILSSFTTDHEAFLVLYYIISNGLSDKFIPRQIYFRASYTDEPHKESCRRCMQGLLEQELISIPDHELNRAKLENPQIMQSFRILGVKSLAILLAKDGADYTACVTNLGHAIVKHFSENEIHVGYELYSFRELLSHVTEYETFDEFDFAEALKGVNVTRKDVFNIQRLENILHSIDEISGLRADVRREHYLSSLQHIVITCIQLDNNFAREVATHHELLDRLNVNLFEKLD